MGFRRIELYWCREISHQLTASDQSWIMGIDSNLNATSQSQQPLIIQGWTWGLNEKHSRQAVERAAEAKEKEAKAAAKAAKKK